MELVLKNITKTYGSKVALKCFSANLTPGIYGLLGPNGAGKSTIMNIIAGNLDADGGSINYDGQDVQKMGIKFRTILGFMPQHQGLYDGMSALRFMNYMAALKGMHKKETRTAVSEALKKVGLYTERNKKLKAFSGGMKQRVLIAQAILNNPEIIILDEPTAGLDPKQRIIIRNLISEISIHKIVLIATHVVSDIAYIAKQVLLINNGILLRQDTIPNLLKTVDGKVFKTKVDEKGFDELKAKFKISNVYKTADNLIVRIICENGNKKGYWNEVEPILEDVYLHLFGDEDMF